MTTQIYVRLKIISDTLLPQEIEKTVGIQSDESWKSGDLKPRTKIISKENVCIYSSGLTVSEDLDLHVANLLKRLVSVTDNIKILSQDNTVELSIVIYSSERPALCFDKEIIDTLSKFGASLDIDLYILPEDN